MHSCIPKTKGQSSEGILSWVSDVHIPFELPFANMKAVVNIGKFTLLELLFLLNLQPLKFLYVFKNQKLFNLEQNFKIMS